jgi:hypothetical protein
MDSKLNIYSEAIKTIVGFHKRSLLDFIDAIERSNGDPRIKDALGKIKGRVHNDLSQCTFNLGVLLTVIESGGDIKPFEDNLIFNRSDSQKRTFERPRYDNRNINSNKHGNPVISKDQANGIKKDL